MTQLLALATLLAACACTKASTPTPVAPPLSVGLIPPPASLRPFTSLYELPTPATAVPMGNDAAPSTALRQVIHQAWPTLVRDHSPDGWHTYFLVLGLLRDGNWDQALRVAEQALGPDAAVPPASLLLARTMMAIVVQQSPHRDFFWVRRNLRALLQPYQYWTDEAHSTPTGLARYTDAKECPEPAGPPGLDIAPIGLNSLLYAMEADLATLHGFIGGWENSASWKRRADQRAALINQFNWDEAKGLYLDYNFKDGKTREVVYSSSFWALWAGLATPQRAARVVANARFEQSDGMPLAWAPLQLFAVEGLRRYGQTEAMERAAMIFLSQVTRLYATSGFLPAGPDGSPRSNCELADTAGVFAELYATLTSEDRARLDLADSNHPLQWNNRSSFSPLR